MWKVKGEENRACRNCFKQKGQEIQLKVSKEISFFSLHNMAKDKTVEV